MELLRADLAWEPGLEPLGVVLYYDACGAGERADLTGCTPASSTSGGRVRRVVSAAIGGAQAKMARMDAMLAAEGFGPKGRIAVKALFVAALAAPLPGTAALAPAVPQAAKYGRRAVAALARLRRRTA